MKAEDWLCDIYLRKMKALCLYIEFLQRNHGSRISIDIQDCAQDVFLILWEKKESLFSHPNIDGWLRQTAKYVFWKRKAREEIDESHIAFHLDAVLKDNMESIGSVISNPPDQYKDHLDDFFEKACAIIGNNALTFLMEYYNKEISIEDMIAKYHISESGIRLRAKRALDRLRSSQKF